MRGGATNEIKSTKPITSEELKKYDNRNKGLWQETGSLTFKDEGAGFKIESKDTLSILQHSVLEATGGIFDFYDDSQGRETKMRITPQSITCFNAEAAGVTFKIDYKGLTFQEESGEQLPQIKLVRTGDSFAINKSMLSGASSYPTSLSFDSNTLTFSQTYGSAVRSMSFTPGLDISSTVESGTATFYLNEGVYSGVISGVPDNRITFPKGRVTLATTADVATVQANLDKRAKSYRHLISVTGKIRVNNSDQNVNISAIAINTDPYEIQEYQLYLGSTWITQCTSTQIIPLRFDSIYAGIGSVRFGLYYADASGSIKSSTFSDGYSIVDSVLELS